MPVTHTTQGWGEPVNESSKYEFNIISDANFIHIPKNEHSFACLNESYGKLTTLTFWIIENFQCIKFNFYITMANIKFIEFLFYYCYIILFKIGVFNIS